MYSKLPDYGDFRRFDLSNEMELSATSQRIFAGFPETPWLTLKRHLFNMRIPGKLFKAIRAKSTNDKKDEFTQERLFQRVDKVHISRTPNELKEMSFEDYGDGGLSPYAGYLSALFHDYFYRY